MFVSFEGWSLKVEFWYVRDVCQRLFRFEAILYIYIVTGRRGSFLKPRELAPTPRPMVSLTVAQSALNLSERQAWKCHADYAPAADLTWLRFPLWPALATWDAVRDRRSLAPHRWTVSGLLGKLLRVRKMDNVDTRLVCDKPRHVVVPRQRHSSHVKNRFSEGKW